MRRNSNGMRAGAAVLLAIVASAILTSAAGAVAGAGFTTVDESVDGTGHCQNGNPTNNCNIYDGKQFVWLNGGPAANGLSPAGDYFFSVLSPGGQANPNDGGANNLSDDFDQYTNRTFTVDNTGEVSAYSGTHDLDSGSGALNSPDGNPPFIRLAPYADTTNPGGVYIMAICSLSTGYPVNPKDCKYDAFKINSGGGNPPVSDLTAIKDATPTFTRTYTWGISKTACLDGTSVADGNCATTVSDSGGSATFNYDISVTHDSGTDSAWAVSGTITVFNINGFDVSGVDVADAIHQGTTPADPLDSNVSCDVTGGSDATILAMDSADFAYTCTYTKAPAAGSKLNVADISWSGNSGNGLADGSTQATFPFSFPTDPTTVSDDTVDVTDPNAPDPPYTNGDLGQVSASDASPTVFSYSKTFTDDAGTCTQHENTASFATLDGILAAGVFHPDQSGSASQTVTQCVGADLTVTKTAAASFTRRFHWSITKAVDKTVVRKAYPGTATFNYTVKASHGAATDSLWKVKGTITVTNPNDFEAVTYDLADALDTGSNGTCSITGGGTGLTVAAGGTKTSNYTCSFTTTPSPTSGTNTATATWNAATYFTPDASAPGTAGYAFGNPTTVIDNCVTVTDTFNGVTSTLGSPCATLLTAQTFTFMYSHTVNVPQLRCVFYDNTATFTTNTTGTTGSAGKTVEVCPTVPGLTMGYWHNKNGQARITGGTSTAGVCDSGTFLRQYAPFQDLSATATCKQVAAYALNVISGGGTNCGGATCNAMLKAQMLATALNVAFGVTPGGELIDLTHGCSMIDTSSGSGSCSGTESWSAAFGGATSLTVSQMLAYAGSQSNVGGSTWYGQVKATQVLAKDAFDAINNGVAQSA